MTTPVRLSNPACSKRQQQTWFHPALTTFLTLTVINALSQNIRDDFSSRHTPKYLLRLGVNDNLVVATVKVLNRK